ncbi:MAG: hypothetical protein QXF76_05085 [Candidatus Anstonellales archaeon]
MTKYESTLDKKRIVRNTYEVSLIIKEITRGKDIEYKRLKKAFSLILENKVEQKDLHFGALFAALKTKRPTEEEIIALLDTALQLDEFNNKEKIKLDYLGKIYNMVGSGKDDIKTFNVSTTAAFIASAGGLRVAKNSSYATAGITGSRDILEGIGINLNLPTSKMIEALEKYGIAFFAIENQIPKFDKAYGGKFFFIHPLSYILPALVLPIYVDGVLYGIADIDTELSARLLKKYNFDNSMVVCGMNNYKNKYIDEISIFRPTKITEIRNRSIKTYIFHPERIGLKLAKEKEIISNINREENTLTFLRILSGLDNGPRSEMTCLNSGALLYISGICDSIKEGYSLSKELIESKQPLSKLQALVNFTGGNTKKFDALVKKLYV